MKPVKELTDEELKKMKELIKEAKNNPPFSVKEIKFTDEEVCEWSQNVDGLTLWWADQSEDDIKKGIEYRRVSKNGHIMWEGSEENMIKYLRRRMKRKLNKNER